MAGPVVRIRSIVEEEISVIEHGQKVSRFVQVPSGAIGRGIKLYFTLTIVNEGDGEATNVTIDNPIPPGTFYAIGSATCEEGVVSCSDDEGVSFHSENEQLSARHHCTDIRWIIDDLPPGSSCILGFQVIVGNVAASANFWTIFTRRILSMLPKREARRKKRVPEAFNTADIR